MQIRLAYCPGKLEQVGRKRERERAMSAPTVRLAHTMGAQGDNKLLSPCAKYQLEKYPALLISYVYLKPFLKNQDKYHYRDWVLDSGAFSAHNSGTEIKNKDYIAVAKDLLAKDKTLTEVFALDVIGDYKASLKNCEEAWKAGVPAIPTFHVGEPWKVLLDIAKTYPKIALGGMVGKPRGVKEKFIEQSFARVWPKRVHGFGLCTRDLLMKFPFHSVDATNWEIGPCKFGRWASFGQLCIRGSKQNLRAEVEYYLRLEYEARQRWKKEMALLDGECAQADRLSASSGAGREMRKLTHGSPVAERERERVRPYGSPYKQGRDECQTRLRRSGAQRASLARKETGGGGVSR